MEVISRSSRCPSFWIAPGYFGLVVCRTIGALLSEPWADRAEFDLRAWDGSDLFRVTKTRVIVVSERVAGALDNSGFTGFSLEKVHHVGTNQ